MNRPAIRISKNQTTMAYLRVILVACLAPIRCIDARSWVELVDPTIYESLVLDPYRLQFLQELDPFNYSTGEQHGIQENIAIKETPSATNASAPANSYSTNNGTERYESCNQDEIYHVIRMYDAWGDGWDFTKMEIFNGSNVRSSNDSDSTALMDLFQHVRKRENSNERNLLANSVLSDGKNKDDEWESRKEILDGFTGSNAKFAGLDTNINNRASLSKMIKLLGSNGQDSSTSNLVFTGTLEDGSLGNSSLCLKEGVCYQVFVEGGLWSEEVKWEIRQTKFASDQEQFSPLFLPLAKGSAPANCRFSVQNPETGEQACPFSCEGGVANETFIAEGTNEVNGSSSSHSNVWNNSSVIPWSDSDAPSYAPSQNINSDEPSLAYIMSLRHKGEGHDVSDMPSDTRSDAPSDTATSNADNAYQIEYTGNKESSSFWGPASKNAYQQEEDTSTPAIEDRASMFSNRYGNGMGLFSGMAPDVAAPVYDLAALESKNETLDFTSTSPSPSGSWTWMTGSPYPSDSSSMSVLSSSPVATQTPSPSPSGSWIWVWITASPSPSASSLTTDSSSLTRNTNHMSSPNDAYNGPAPVVVPSTMAETSSMSLSPSMSSSPSGSWIWVTSSPSPSSSMVDSRSLSSKAPNLPTESSSLFHNMRGSAAGTGGSSGGGIGSSTNYKSIISELSDLRGNGRDR